MTPGERRFSWLSPAPLWQSRNDRLTRWFGDPTDERRRAWMVGRAADNPDLVVERSPTGTTSFLVLGDTGEGDTSQYAVVPSLLSRAENTDFMFICSDVIYPAGGIDEYEEKFFRPYAGYPRPIYAVPGNHDWYDDCTGFMYWFCGAEQAPRRKPSGFSPKALLSRLLWRGAPGANPQRVAEARAMRAQPGQQATQPASYLAIDTGPLRLVGIDTGIGGDIDRDQGDWLRRVSSNSPKPKILLSGKPIYVDGEHHPGPIEGGGTVDEIITARQHNYVAAIGGDIHNYQRYAVKLRDGRTLPYLVNGGGGAFMHETHTIPNLDTVGLHGVSERGFRCYPLRGDSLSRFSQLWSRKRLGRLRGARPIEPDIAAAIVGRRLQLTPVRASAQQVEVSGSDEQTAEVLFNLPGRARGALHFPFSEYLDWNEPPLFKSFLRVEAADREVRIRCFGVAGCGEQEQNPPVEDAMHAERSGDGSWVWDVG